MEEDFNLPLAVAIIVGVFYNLLGALVCMFSQNWTYFDAMYFVFISLSTVGLGDVAPTRLDFFTVYLVYMLVGLALVAMIVNAQTAALNVTISRATTRVIKVGQRLTSAGNLRDTRAEQPSASPPSLPNRRRSVP